MSDKADAKTGKKHAQDSARKEQAPKGLLDAFRDFVGQWERGVNQFANEAMGNEQFARLMHGATSAAAGANSCRLRRPSLRSAISVFLPSDPRWITPKSLRIRV